MQNILKAQSRKTRSDSERHLYVVEDVTRELPLTRRSLHGKISLPELQTLKLLWILSKVKQSKPERGKEINSELGTMISTSTLIEEMRMALHILLERNVK